MDTSVYRHNTDDALGHLSPYAYRKNCKTLLSTVYLVAVFLLACSVFKNFIPMRYECS